MKYAIFPTVLGIVLILSTVGCVPNKQTQSEDTSNIAQMEEQDVIPVEKPKQVAPGGLKNNMQIPDDLEIIRNIEYGKGGTRPITMNIYRLKDSKAKSKPAVVWIHGGGWQNGGKDVDINRIIGLAREEFIVASIEYRLSGEAIFPAQIEDCKTAIRFLRAKSEDYNIDPEHIGVWGGSAGGHLVALLGTTGYIKDLEGTGGWNEYSSRVQAVCDWFGPTDLTGRSIESPAVSKLLGGTGQRYQEIAVKASPVHYVAENMPPFLIMHGDKDPVVPISQSQILYDALKKTNTDVTFYTVKGTAHGFKGIENSKTDSMESLYKMVIDFFVRTLK